jgi:Rrf2 family protein
MRVSQRLDYALRALTALAQEPQGSPIVAGELADRLGLPRRFLEQQVTTLAKNGLVSCRRGTSGGCSLARPADTITVAEVVKAIQGDIIDIPRTTGSAVAEMWSDSAEVLGGVLGRVTIRTLAERQAELDSQAAMYYI